MTIRYALQKKLEGDYAHARANLIGLLVNPTFTGDHGDLVDEASKWLIKLDEAKSRLETLREITNSRNSSFDTIIPAILVLMVIFVALMILMLMAIANGW